MNARAKGALEALAFARSKVTDRKARQEIQSVIDQLLDADAQDFNHRVKYF